MFNRKAQSTLEYALIIGVVVAGLLLMQYYVKRGLAGRYKASSDDLGDQYDPTRYTGSFETVSSSNVRQTVKGGVTPGERTTRTEHMGIQKNEKTGNDATGAYTSGEDLYLN